MNNIKMAAAFNLWETNRTLYLRYLNNLSLEQLNYIPDGFNNNIIWNVGHVVVVQQALIYKTSGLEGYLSETLFNSYKPGTKPTKEATQDDVDALKKELISIIQITKTDYKNKLFSTFKPFKTSTGFNIFSIEASILFNNYHEALHFGHIKSLEKFI